MNKTSIRNYSYRCIAIALAVGPLVWIYWRLDFSRLMEYIPQIAWWTIPALCGFIILSTILQGVRWWIVLRAFVPDLSFLRTMSYHFIGVFYSIVLPTSASTDVVKTVLMSKKVDYSVAWGAILICRILGFFTLVIFSVYGLLTIKPAFLPQGFWLSLSAAVVIMAVIILLSFSKRLTSPFRPMVEKIASVKLLSIIEKLRQGIYLYRTKTGSLAVLFLVTCVTQCTLVLLGCVTLYGVAGRFLLSDYFAFIPIIEIVANAGPTPNGIGVREGGTALFFKYLNVSNEQLGIYVFITLFFAIAVRLLGGVAVIHGMAKKKS